MYLTLTADRQRKMISLRTKVCRNTVYTLSRYNNISRHDPASLKTLARSSQTVQGSKAIGCRYTSRTTLAQNMAYGIKEFGNFLPRKMIHPSNEQKAIVELCRTQNVVVSARPGAGKTATAEAIIAANPDRPIAIITYSKRLQLDTAKRLNAYLWSDVFTFHGLAGLLFSITVPTDFVLRSLREQRTVPAWSGRPYEIIIIDELQDCTDDLFWLICAFISAVTDARGGKAPQIVVLGDERQAIYEFRGADSRYLGLSSLVMAALSPYPWNHLQLSKSFRLSHENSAFVNNVFLGGYSYIIGSHNGSKPLYLHGNQFDVKSIVQQLIPLIRQYGPEQTAILAPSTRRSKPLALLTNYLSEGRNIPIAIPNSDDVPLNDKVLRGKVCVSTYHQFKGNERDLVIVYGADASYFESLARDLPDDECPNAVFVALTRARKRLVMVHHNQNCPMPFINVAELYRTSEFVNLEDNKLMRSPKSMIRPQQLCMRLPKICLASDLARHVPDDIIEGICAKNLEINQALPPLPDSLHIDAPSIILTSSKKKHYEAVSDLNGLAVVAAYEHALLGTLNTLGKSNKSIETIPSNSKTQATWLCRQACKYDARVSGYKARSIQMKGHPFDWLEPYLDAARDRLEAKFSKSYTLHFEVPLEEKDFRITHLSGSEDHTTHILGRADIIQYDEAFATSAADSKQKKKKQSTGKIKSAGVSIWEIKFVAQLSLEHVIQACIYAYLWSTKHKRVTPPRIILFNIRDGEKWEIVPRDGVASLRDVVEETLIAKFSSKKTMTTDEFLKKCESTKAEVDEGFGKKR